MTRRVVALGIVVLLGMWTAGCGRAAHALGPRGYLVAGVSLWLPPFGFPTPGGWSGLDVALARSLGQVVYGDPHRVHLLPLAPGDRRWVLAHGEVDVVIAAFAHPAAHLDGADLVGPYYTAPLQLLVRAAESGAPWGFLDGTLIGYLEGGQAPAIVTTALPAGVHPVFMPFASAAAAAADLASGRIAALAAPGPTCQALAGRDGQLRVRALPGAPDEPYWVLVRPGDGGLAADVARAIALLPRGVALRRQVTAWNAAAMESPVPHGEALPPFDTRVTPTVESAAG